MDKALSGELSCPCDRSCFVFFLKTHLLNSDVNSADTLTVVEYWYKNDC